MDLPNPFADGAPSPLTSEDPQVWERLIDAVGRASLLVFIDSRLGTAVRERVGDEDVLQEALMHAWRDRLSCEWRGLQAFRRWLLQVIENRIRKVAEKRFVVPLDPTPSASASEPGDSGARGGGLDGVSSTTPSRIASNREQAVAIREALAELPVEVREVVRLRLIEELEMEEVAARLGIGVSAAYHRFRKGIGQYRLRLRHLWATRSQSIGGSAIAGEHIPPGA